jgi:MFS family permease
MASGILSGMDGDLGVAAWRWLFYIEGALTIFVAFCSIFILPDFPSTTRWLTPTERRLAEKRLEEDVGLGDETDTGTGQQSGQILPLEGLKMAVLDWKVWWLALALTAMVVSLSFNA